MHQWGWLIGETIVIVILVRELIVTRRSLREDREAEARAAASESKPDD